ncbi:MAG: hypothetical protein LBP90_05750, partial [Burkholderiales bacterium]|nr:hypothetical protein [Burkholderiales bacterium]
MNYSVLMSESAVPEIRSLGIGRTKRKKRRAETRADRLSYAATRRQSAESSRSGFLMSRAFSAHARCFFPAYYGFVGSVFGKPFVFGIFHARFFRTVFFQ